MIIKKIKKVFAILIAVTIIGSCTAETYAKADDFYAERIKNMLGIGKIEVTVSRSISNEYTQGPVIITLEITSEKEIKRVTVRTDKEDRTTGTPITVNGNKCEFTAEENGHWYFLIEDEEGNTFDQGVAVSNIDKTPATDEKPTVYQTSDTQIMVQCNQKDEESKIKEKYYRLAKDANGSSSLEGFDWKKTLSFNKLELNKEYYVQTKVINGAGVETVSKITTITLVKGKVEEVPEELSSLPKIEVSYSTDSQTWVKEEVLTIKVSDSKGIKEVTAGRADSQTRTKLSTSENEGTEKTYTYTIKENDTKYSIIAINQNDGKKTFNITFHNIDPVAPTDDAPTVTKGSASNTIKVVCNQKDNESKVNKTYCRFKKDGGEYSDWKELSGEVLINGNGNYVIQTKAVDKAGNETISKEVAYKVNGTEPSPEPGDETISSDMYTINTNTKIITRVRPETTKEEFRKHITVSTGAYSILDKDGNSASDDYIKTGYKLKTGNNTYEISVIGDIAPNGKVDVQDLTKIRPHIVGITGSTLTGLPLMSADISGDGEVNVIDLTRIRALIVGTFKL